ncbi:unnamed protein product [Thelazia callipaeda]|uniref:RRM domain-containing protein n=1 Tax=Thelazia callipaeda TaxID=103827 RepID=A0A0N5D8M2_THECL|nr:unnamed protein product [Thelazia callipaeda]
MDEDELFLDSASTFDAGNLSEMDELAILGDEDIQDDESVREESGLHHEETEELDYDEDLETEKTPRLSKFSSERIKSVNSEKNSFATTKERLVKSGTPTAARTPKVFINPHHKNVIRPRASASLNLPLPWEAPIAMCNIASIRPPVVLPPPNNVLMLPQPLPFPVSGSYWIVPSSSADFSRPPPQIMPLPNYSTPPPLIVPNQFVVESVGSIPSVGQWDQMVEGFLRRTTARSRSRFSRSPRSSRSRSRSRSYSSHSSSSTVSSRSSSRSPYRRVHSRNHRSSSRRPFSYRSRPEINETIRRHPGDRLRQSTDNRKDSMFYSERSRNELNDITKQEKTIECAKAIGLDYDYLHKLEEQKKMREEILRRKEERRIQSVRRRDPLTVTDEKIVRNVSHAANFNDRRIDRDRGIDEGHSRKRECDDKIRKISSIKNGTKGPERGADIGIVQKSLRRNLPICVEKMASGGINISNVSRRNESAMLLNDSGKEVAANKMIASRYTERESDQQVEGMRKKRAYLVVVVNSLNLAPISVDRIRIIAETIGSTKKVWKSSENTVSLIFEQHESAKKFMFQYNNRVIHGVQFAVTLQKLFANISELR